MRRSRVSYEECPDWCRSANELHEYCMLQSGCKTGARYKCPHKHAQPMGKRRWFIPEDSRLGTHIKVNGVLTYKMRCSHCGVESSPIPNEQARYLMSAGFEVEWARNETEPAVACCVTGCTNTGYEWHHFAPRNTFPDAEDWPVEKLCVTHHRYWHQMMDGYRWNAKASQLNTANQ
jgi:hypothetical protein